MYSRIETVDNNTHPYLHIIPTHTFTNEFYALCTMCRAYDYNYNEFQNYYYDINRLNDSYKTLWLSVEPSFYTKRKDWLDEVKRNYSGLIINADLNPDVINNVIFAYDLRVGYVYGNLTYLSGSTPITQQIQNDILEFANENQLDIGIINLYKAKFSINNYWELNVTKTDDEAAMSAQFMNSVFRSIGAPEYWNKVYPEDINICSNYMEAMYHLDLDYVDNATTKTLVVHDSNNLFHTQLSTILRSKDVSSISFCDGRGLLTLPLNDFDTIFFIVGDDFFYKHATAIQRIKQQYEGKLINFDFLSSSTRDAIFDKWLSNNIPCPRYKSVFGYNVPHKEEVPFDLPYVLRLTDGHSGRSNMVQCVTHNYVKEYPWWIWGDIRADWMIQEFVDVSVDGTYDCGRLLWVYDKVFPMYALRDKMWECRPRRTSVTHRSVGKNCFSVLIRGFDKVENFDEQIRNIIKATDIDIGVLDFSVKDGKVIPWDVNIKWGNGLIRHWEEEYSNTMTEILNTIFEGIGNPLRLQSWETKILLKEAEVEAREWNRVVRIF